MWWRKSHLLVPFSMASNNDRITVSKSGTTPKSPPLTSQKQRVRNGHFSIPGKSKVAWMSGNESRMGIGAFLIQFLIGNHSIFLNTQSVIGRIGMVICGVFVWLQIDWQLGCTTTRIVMSERYKSLVSSCLKKSIKILSLLARLWIRSRTIFWDERWPNACT